MVTRSERVARTFTNLFLLWVILFSVAAYVYPRAFLRLAPHINLGLGLIMFGMGITLEARDFMRVAHMPYAVLCGVFGQFLIMPLAAVILSRAFRLSPELSMGLIILGSCPGGTASNVITYLAKGDVPLSVTMTACTTVLAVAMTPILVWVLGGTYLPVEPWALLKSVLTIVLLPVAAGMLAHKMLREGMRPFCDIFPAISVLFIALVIAAVVARNQTTLASVGGMVLLVALLHNLMGLVCGYFLACLFRLPRQACRTIAIEVGMQNSGLGASLATTHYAAAPIVALPSALFSVLHNLTGSLLASWWSRRAHHDDAGNATRNPGALNGTHTQG